MNDIPIRLQRLQSLMRERELAAYVIPTADYHNSEYVSEYFRAREYFSGFTGSAGTLVVLRDRAYLFTDGRYFLQARQELESSGIELMRIGEKDVPEIGDFLHDALQENESVGFDGRTMDAKTVRAYAALFADKDIEIRSDEDLISPIWTDRPPLPEAKIWTLPLRYAGERAEDKLNRLRDAMKQQGAEVWALGECEDIAYLLNLRGGDLPHTPVPLCFCFVELHKVLLFIDPKKRTEESDEALLALGVEFRPYEGVLGYSDRYREGTTVLLSNARINYTLFQALSQNAIVLEAPDLIAKGRSVKNAVQIENLKKAHEKDGAALTRFMRYIKENAGKNGVNELSAAKTLDALRAALPGALGPSFDTICAYGAHGAIIHYRADEKSSMEIEAKGLLLVDSGGQYYEGTSDVTRTYALGALTKEERFHYTLVLKGMLALMNARFPAGTTGAQLDVFARAPIWRAGLDYRHGTGHGVGYLLGVHEDPVRIRHSHDAFVFEAGMVVSDEPGIYAEGEHGIRLENLLLCVKDGDTPYGGMLRFEPLTMAPLDLDAIDASLLSEEEKLELNSYHARVRETLLPYFAKDEDMRQTLLESTRAI